MLTENISTEKEKAAEFSAMFCKLSEAAQEYVKGYMQHALEHAEAEKKSA